MNAKACFKCGMVKKLSEYYVHKQMADGHLNKCKECTKRDSLANRNNNLDYYQKYDMERATTTNRIESHRRYLKSEKGKEKSRKAHQKYISKFPEKRKAHILVWSQLRADKLARPPGCQECSVECRPEAHHCDYKRPLDVMWLCHNCHVEWHKNNTPIYHEVA